MEILIMAAQLILGLSILVGLHEAGHMFAAKAFGMRVEKFSIGFPPKIWSKKIGDTEYQIGALPLGGFVKISGMIDESLDTELMQKEPEPWEFRAKPAWQRLIVMLGGIIVNVITGIIIFVMILSFWGKDYTSKDEVNKYGIYVTEDGRDIGLKQGDKIVNINGEDYDNFKDVMNFNLLTESDAYYTVERDGKQFKIDLPKTFANTVAKLDKGDTPPISALMPYQVLEVPKSGGKEGKPSIAEQMGLAVNDKIVTIDGQPTRYFQELRAALAEKSCTEVKIEIKKAKTGEVEVKTVKVPNTGTLGFKIDNLLENTHKEYSFGEALSVGTVDAFTVVWVQLKAFKKMFAGEINPVNSLGSFLTIADIYGGNWVWSRFWQITGLLSMVLAFMNLLPIPALDGGHVVFLTYEIISGRAPSDKFLENAQKVGMVILLSLMVFVIGLDVYKHGSRALKGDAEDCVYYIDSQPKVLHNIKTD